MGYYRGQGTNPVTLAGDSTPNKRLAFWAESRKLSVDTAEIISQEDSKRRFRRKPVEVSKVGVEISHGSASTNSNYSSGIDEYPPKSFWNSDKRRMGCFSFLLGCRCK